MTVGLYNVQNEFSGKLETRNFTWVCYDWAYHQPYNGINAIPYGPHWKLCSSVATYSK